MAANCQRRQRALIHPAARAVGGIKAINAAFAAAHDDDSLLNGWRTQHFTGKLGFPQLLAVGIEGENFPPRGADEHRRAVAADAAGEPVFRIDARELLATAYIEARDLPRGTGGVNRGFIDRRGKHMPLGAARVALPQNLGRRARIDRHELSRFDRGTTPEPLVIIIGDRRTTTHQKNRRGDLHRAAAD
jgi:hypothetical protein